MQDRRLIRNFALLGAKKATCFFNTMCFAVKWLDCIKYEYLKISMIVFTAIYNYTCI